MCVSVCVCFSERLNILFAFCTLVQLLRRLKKEIIGTKAGCIQLCDLRREN